MWETSPLASVHRPPGRWPWCQRDCYCTLPAFAAPLLWLPHSRWEFVLELFSLFQGWRTRRQFSSLHRVFFAFRPFSWRCHIRWIISNFLSPSIWIKFDKGYAIPAVITGRSFPRWPFSFSPASADPVRCAAEYAPNQRGLPLPCPATWHLRIKPVPF